MMSRFLYALIAFVVLAAFITGGDWNSEQRPVERVYTVRPEGHTAVGSFTYSEDKADDGGTIPTITTFSETDPSSNLGWMCMRGMLVVGYAWDKRIKGVVIQHRFPQLAANGMRRATGSLDWSIGSDANSNAASLLHAHALVLRLFAERSSMHELTVTAANGDSVTDTFTLKKFTEALKLLPCVN